MLATNKKESQDATACHIAEKTHVVFRGPPTWQDSRTRTLDVRLHFTSLGLHEESMFEQIEARRNLLTMLIHNVNENGMLHVSEDVQR